MNNDDRSKINSENCSIKHLSFKECFQNDWRKYFQEKETIQSIMDSAGLSSSHDFEQVKARYLIDDDRVAVVALIKRKNENVLEKLVFDVIAGNYSFDQFYNVLYNIGSDCDYRIIIYDHNSNIYIKGTYMTDAIMRELTEKLDGHLFLCFISSDATRDENNHAKISFNVKETATRHQCSFDCPTRREFEYAELYRYANDVLTSMGFSMEMEPFLQFDGTLHDEDATNEWKEDGMVVEIEMDNDDFIYLFTKRRDEMPDHDCSYDKNNNLLSIKINIPFQNFVNSIPEDKRLMAVDYYHNVRLGTSIKDLIDERSDDE